GSRSSMNIKSAGRQPERELRRFQSVSLTSEDNHHAEVGEYLPNVDVEMAMADRMNGNDVFLADGLEKICDCFVKAIFADFLALRVANRFDANLFVTVFRGHFEAGLGLFDQALGSAVLGNGKMLVHLECRRS